LPVSLWGHNVVLLFKLTKTAERLWYAQQATGNGWSRSMLEHWIESELYARQGEAVTNFKSTLPPPQSDLASAIVRDPYNFDFLTLRGQAYSPISVSSLSNWVRVLLLWDNRFIFR
jgi:predicted nuclease of restriction endonuclease-like (RecB) superfamily